MKKRKYTTALSVVGFVLLLLASCTSKKEVADEEQNSTTAVTLTHIQHGRINDSFTITATTVYQKKIVIVAPISAFVSKIFVDEGNRVEEDQPLFRIESKEHKALGNESLLDVGLITIKSTFDGVVTNVTQQEGSYVQEGTGLCTIADRNSFVFQLNVPFAFSRYIKKGDQCTLVMPDDSKLVAKIGETLTSMNTASQTQAVIAVAKTKFLPEGLIVKAIINKDEGSDSTQILPRSAIQSNESLTQYWILKLVNDSLAVKVPITVGNNNKENVEVLSPQLAVSDRIVLTGGYQMPDSATVVVDTQSYE